MNEQVANSWLVSCFTHCRSIKDLSDPRNLFLVLSEFEPDLFSHRAFEEDVSFLREQKHVSVSTFQKVAFLRHIVFSVLSFLSQTLNNQAISLLLSVDLNELILGETSELLKMVEVLLFIGVNCANKHKILDCIAALDEQSQQQLMFIISRICLESSDSASEIKILSSEKAALEDKVNLL